jgi:hypothetical protein
MATSVATQNIVQVQLTSESYRYLLRLLDLGVLQGTAGALTINPSVRPLIDCLYEVLAGGSVQITAATAGTPTTLTMTSGVPQTVNDLKSLETDSLARINDVNGKVGYGLVVAL